jgi:hypothetical protein
MSTALELRQTVQEVKIKQTKEGGGGWYFRIHRREVFVISVPSSSTEN